MKDAKKETISGNEIGININNRENGLSSMHVYLHSYSRREKKVLSEQGFTLIELLVVLVIIAILASYIAPKIIGRPEEAKRTMAAVQIQGLETALKVYKLDNGMYPSTEQGLSALVEQPTVGKLPPKWKKGGYLEKGKVPKDPWGNEFIYLCPGAHSDFDLSSRGADGESGGEEENADLNNWQLEK
jgi:general secretion pathway protein G